MTRWSDLPDRPDADAYAARFADAAASGQDVHGEARLVDTLCRAVFGRAVTVLDAGCGTGRVGIRLAELGHDVTGVDAEDAMLDVARRDAPGLPWVTADLAELDLDGVRFDVVLLAGNVVPLLAPGTLPAVVAHLAAHLEPGGLVVAGFGTDVAHLPRGCPVTPLAEWDAALAAAGLVVRERFSSWDAEPWAEDGERAGYAVSVHSAARRPPAGAPGAGDASAGTATP